MYSISVFKALSHYELNMPAKLKSIIILILL